MSNSPLTPRETQIVIELVSRIKWLIIFIIPIWAFTFWVKDKIILIFKRISLSISLIISIDGFYEIDGKQGQLTHFGWRRITLQGVDGKNYYVPMELAVRSTITRLNSLNGFHKRRDSDANEVNRKMSATRSKK